MRIIRDIFHATSGVRKAAIKSWSKVCTNFFDVVTACYPHLIETNIKNLAPATLDLLEHGITNDPSVLSSQYPALHIDRLVDRLEEPVFRSLYEVGAIQIDSSGNVVVEPNPAVLLRGLARLALPTKYLIGIINAARQWRGQAVLTERQFLDLDTEVFSAVKKGLHRTLGEQWFRTLNRASYLARRAFVLPCTPLRGSQEFYEEGISFYRNQGSDANVYIYSTTSGLVIPREFSGDASKNHYRYRYFTEGILGRTSVNRVYQWERFRTAKELARGYEQISGSSAKAQYHQDAIETLRRFSSSPNLAIMEVGQFPLWKEWHTLVGPIRQQMSIRPQHMRGKIGHGIVYDADAFRSRADTWSEIGKVVAVGTACQFDLLKKYGPALLFAAAGCGLISAGYNRLARLVNEPLISKCSKDQEKALPIKRLGQKLTPREIERVVSDLLDHGKKILALEGR